MMEWTAEKWEEEEIQKDPVFLYLYTPLCGTCMVASKMLTIIETMKPEMKIGKMDLNYSKELAEKYEVESVPCLLVVEESILKDKVYRFESVPHLLEVCNRYISI